MPDSKIIFIHIPKAAGSTLAAVLKRKYKDRVLFLDGSKANESIDNFIASPVAKRNQYDMIFGHMDFGLHEHISGFGGYMTIFREPVDRVISYYRYIKKIKRHYLHQTVVEKNMTLHEFIEADLTTEMDNGQVRMIAGFGGFHKADPKDQGYCSESDLKKAIHNLDNFFIGFGIKEYFDESLLLLSKKAGWGAMNYLSKNVNKKQKKSEAIPQKTLELIKDKNKFDLQFYKYAKQNFEETLNSEGSKFSCEKRKLELSNKLILRYSRLRPYFLK